MSTTPNFIYAPEAVFRGTRNYVHSTDIYAELIAGAIKFGLTEVSGLVELRFSSAIVSQPVFHFAPEAFRPPAQAAATFKLGSGRQTQSGFILTRDAPVTRRVIYDEGPIWSAASSDGDTIRITSDTGMKPIEVVTALAVLQHKLAIAPPDDKRWLLTRLSLRRPLIPRDAAWLEITLDRVLARTMTKSTIKAEDGILGTLDFSLGTR